MSEQWPLPSAAEERAEIERLLGAEMAGRLASVKLVVLDCDGILTRGNLIYGPQGEALKEFDAQDGLGLMMLMASGVARAVLTGRTSAMVERRCLDLRFESIKMGRFDKMVALEEIWQETGCSAAETLYMGDDLLDVPALAAVALPVTVPAAPPEVKAICAHTTEAIGGQGAVREACDLVLKARGDLGQSIQRLAAGKRPADDPPEVTH